MQSDIIITSNMASNNTANQYKMDKRDLDSMIVVTTDKTEEFKNMRKKYLSRINQDVDNLVLKFKQINLNVSTLLSNVDIEDKLVRNCCVCGTLFGKIFSKKQKCLVCGYFVCSNCNNHPMPINSFDKVKYNNNNNGKPVQNVNVCTLCFKSLNVVLQRKEHQIMREKGSSSAFVEFYEKMHLNTVDLRRNILSYKQLVTSITDSGSTQIKRAKELEQSITIAINELKSGIAKLKELKVSSPKQNQVILHVHHAFWTSLNAVLPDFKLYATELASKMKIPPGSSPTSIKSPVNNLKNTTGDASTSPTSQSPTGISPSNGSGGSRLSTFFSNVFNIGDSSTPTGHRRSGSNNGTSYMRPAYDDLPDKCTILSVVPAVCPLTGGCIAIQGENLDKSSLHITIDGLQVKMLQKKSYGLLIASPARGQEGEYDLVIKDGEHVISRQALFYTNSCFQTEKDVEDSNKYALDHFNKSGITMSGPNDYSQSSSPIFSSSPTLGSYYFNEEEEDESYNESKILAEVVGNIEHNMLVDSNQSDSIAATGNSFDDLVIQMITPVVTPCTGGKITMHLKYPLIAGAVPLITVSGTAVNIEIGSQRKSISFIAPPSSQQGYHKIDIMYQSKYIDLPNVLFYQPDMQALTSNPLSKSNSSTPTMPSMPIPKSSRVWGKK